MIVLKKSQRTNADRSKPYSKRKTKQNFPQDKDLLRAIDVGNKQNKLQRKISKCFRSKLCRDQNAITIFRTDQLKTRQQTKTKTPKQCRERNFQPVLL